MKTILDILNLYVGNILVIDMGGVNALIDVQTNVAGRLIQAEKLLSKSHADILYRFDGEVIS